MVTAAAMVGRTGLAVAVIAVALCACGPSSGPGEENLGVPSPSASASASSPMSPANLPTIAKPTAPPSSPTDNLPRGVLAGRVTALTDTCTEVTTDDGVTWSLVGDAQVPLALGDTVTARVTELDAGDRACGLGSPARLVSIRVAGR